MCPICVEGEKIEKILLSNSLSEDQKRRLQNQKRICDIHKQYASLQRVGFKRSTDLMSPNTCTIVVDFKENLIIGGGPIETSRDFYRKNQVGNSFLECQRYTIATGNPIH